MLFPQNDLSLYCWLHILTPSCSFFLSPISSFNFLVRGCRKGFLNPPLGSSLVVAYIEMGLNAVEGLGVVLMNCLTIVPLWKLKFANYQDLPLSIDRINFLFFLYCALFCHVWNLILRLLFLFQKEFSFWRWFYFFTLNDVFSSSVSECIYISIFTLCGRDICLFFCESYSFSFFLSVVLFLHVFKRLLAMNRFLVPEKQPNLLSLQFQAQKMVQLIGLK